MPHPCVLEMRSSYLAGRYKNSPMDARSDEDKAIMFKLMARSWREIAAILLYFFMGAYLIFVTQHNSKSILSHIDHSSSKENVLMVVLDQQSPVDNKEASYELPSYRNVAVAGSKVSELDEELSNVFVGVFQDDLYKKKGSSFNEKIQQKLDTGALLGENDELLPPNGAEISAVDDVKEEIPEENNVIENGELENSNGRPITGNDVAKDSDDTAADDYAYRLALSREKSLDPKDNATQSSQSINLAPCLATQSSDSSRRNYFVAVFSGPDRLNERLAIRQTWLSQLKNEEQQDDSAGLDLIGYAFVVDVASDNPAYSKILEESVVYNDVLQLDNQSTSRLGGLANWLRTYCKAVDFVLKVDDDVYVNGWNFGNVVIDLDPSELKIYGSLNSSSPALKDGESDMSSNETPSLSNNLSGSALLLPAKIIEPLFFFSFNRSFPSNNDGDVIRLFTKTAGVNISRSDRFFVNLEEGNHLKNPCNIRRVFSWKARTILELETSHEATMNIAMNYYQGAASCIDPATNATADPNVAVPFLFSPD